MKTELIILNLKEIRRRSLKLWKGLPEEHYFWKPDPTAMSALQMIRHVLSADHGWNSIIQHKDMANYKSPWENEPLLNLIDEINFAQPYRIQFLETIQKFSEKQLTTTLITHPGNNKQRLLGDYLLRVGYHEAVHAGQFLSYLRTLNVARPFIWD